MKMSMRILTSHPKLKLGGSWSKQEKEFISLLEEDEEFCELVRKFRNEAGVPEGGFDLDRPVFEYNKTDSFSKIDGSSLFNSSFLLTTLLQLPSYWVYSFTGILLFGLAFPISEIKEPPIEIETINMEVTIHIREKISIKKLRNFLQENSYSFIKAVSNLSRTPKVSLKNFEYRKKVQELRRQGMTINEITEKLVTEYGENKLPTPYLAYETVGRYEQRFGEYLQKTLAKDWRRAFVMKVYQNRHS